MLFKTNKVCPGMVASPDSMCAPGAQSFEKVTLTQWPTVGQIWSQKWHELTVMASRLQRLQLRLDILFLLP
jgi:hypothetical protein